MMFNDLFPLINNKHPPKPCFSRGFPYNWDHRMGVFNITGMGEIIMNNE